MTCTDYRLLIPYRRTGDLLPEDVALLDRHLSSCADCAALAAPHSADTAIQKVINTVDVPATLKASVTAAVAAERRSAVFKTAMKGVALIAIAGLIYGASYGVQHWTRPKLDGEGLAIRNGYEADRTQIPNLLYHWLETEQLPTDLPFEFDFTTYVAHGSEKFGNRYVPFVKFQTRQPGIAFAKLYFVRSKDVDAKLVIDGTQSSFCTVRVVPGGPGMTYLLVHTGSDPAPLIREAKPNVR